MALQSNPSAFRTTLLLALDSTRVAAAQTNGNDSEIPLIDVIVADDLIESFFNIELFFLSTLAVEAVPYDLSMAGMDVPAGEDETVM